MISYLRGTIKFISSNWLILDVGGVGYKVFISPKLIENCKPASPETSQGGLKIENSSELYIYEHIREDADDLYGLETPEELQMFELLVSVSGVGPKMTMNILSTFSANKIPQIIMNSDAGMLSTVTGVGKKLAMKIILDLKSKLDSGVIGNFSDFDNTSGEVADALESLGYKGYEISQYLSMIPQELTTVQDKIKWVLKQKK